ncbi:gamma-glutamyltransferase [Vibrio sp. CAIM 722]|uniref:Gamma-glutamyltransferase n=1 Tax=Vibrio eleionomae TaxID=2653505 RepID=A0A7X4LJY8_9VIBR|nr:gamma-glutamyltransferase family protein [Vibrio eleionomae]MZI93378.1 gamma-glutamyltransferase [Vibrio eleionomae]
MPTNQTSFTAPHAKAAQVGQQILDAGGTASEAMVAAAAMISVQYPHMNGLGGDGFWIIAKPGETPITIDACGHAAHQIDIQAYRAVGTELPDSGGNAAITMAGAVAGWQKALEYDHSNQELSHLLQPAINAAREGITVTDSLAFASHKTFARLQFFPEFGDLYLKNGMPLSAGETVVNPALAQTLEHLAKVGLEDFYRGSLAEQLAQELEAAGSPLRLDDFNEYRAVVGEPLTTHISKGQLYNLGAPTQGLASLLILAIYDQLIRDNLLELDHMHLLVEATKQAFIIRDQVICDPNDLTQPLQTWLDPDVIQQAVSHIKRDHALPWPHVAKPGDTVWMGACDQYGTMVSFIQSVYWEFGSGLVLPSSGIVWNCRGKSFSLDEGHHNCLAPGKKPFHTLNPAYAELSDGRRMVYGTMGGEGQPQTQACLFSRYLYQDYSLQDSVAAPRWLLGRTWGDSTFSLRLEQTLYQQYGEPLIKLGHEITSVPDNNELMGHAGAIVLDTQGKISATSDPRSDGTYTLGE